MSYRIPQKRNLPSYRRQIHRSGGGSKMGKKKSAKKFEWRGYPGGRTEKEWIKAGRPDTTWDY